MAVLRRVLPALHPRSSLSLFTTQMLENDAEQGQEPSVYLATKGAQVCPSQPPGHLTWTPPQPRLTACRQAPKPHAKLDWRAWAWHEADILWDMIRSSWLNLLLVVVPVAIGLGFAHANSTAVFVLVRCMGTPCLSACTASWGTACWACMHACVHGRRRPWTLRASRPWRPPPCLRDAWWFCAVQTHDACLCSHCRTL